MTQHSETAATTEIAFPGVNLPTAQESQIGKLVQEINLADPTLNVTYGTSTMKDISRFADDLLSRVQAKDSGEAGETLTSLMLRVKGIDVAELGKEPSFFERLPLIGSLFNSVQKTVAKFETLADQVAVISNNLESAIVALLHDIEVLEQLYKHNETFHHELVAYIEAGKRKLEEVRTIELPKLQDEAAQSGNPLDAQKVRDLTEQINRFERRVHDLELSRTITIQTAPQIRLIQSNNQALAQKIQTSVLATIPIWKNQMVLALSLRGQKNAAALQKEVADTTNELLRKNAAMLQQTSVETAREVERSIVDIETLRDVHGKLIATIDETLNIAQEGRQKRLAVEQELADMEVELKNRLTAMGKQKEQQNLDHALGKTPLPQQTTEQHNAAESKEGV